jgi:hypothetical protein
MRATRSLATAAVAGTAAIAILAAGSTAGAAPASERLTGQERHVIREATKQYRDVAVALADGYVPVGECAELPGVGGMGYHYLHPELAADTLVDPTQPELLVYHEDRRGQLRLGAVEYFVVDADQDLSTDDDRPMLFGTYPFEGPMDGHEPGMPVHYDLHVWLYRPNPDGQLEGWNPKVGCP